MVAVIKYFKFSENFRKKSNRQYCEWNKNS